MNDHLGDVFKVMLLKGEDEAEFYVESKIITSKEFNELKRLASMTSIIEKIEELIGSQKKIPFKTLFKEDAKDAKKIFDLMRI